MKKYVDEETLNALILRVDDLEAGVSPLKQMYPVGSIYMSMTEINPNELFGFGEWEQIKDTFLLAAGDRYSVGDIGGEAEHVLSINEIPSHAHEVELASANAGSAYHSYGVSSGVLSASYYTNSTGGSAAHNNMPPYLAVYIWKRIF